MESYTKCDCGSGLKYKFCCQKAEQILQKIDRQIESRQLQGLLASIEDGLKRFPETPGLVLRRAMVLALTGDGSQARHILEAYLAKHPAHPGVRQMLILNALENDGPDTAAVELQRGMGQLDADAKAFMANLPGEIAEAFMEEGKPQAALAHALMSVIWANGRSDTVQRLSAIQQNMNYSPWLRTHLDLAQATEKIPADLRARFEAAYESARNDAWLDAAEAYAKLAEKDHSGLALRNQGICLAWMGDNAGAAICLRASLKSLGESEEAVDLEAACQELEPPADDEMVDGIQLTWPIRSREMLLENLEKASNFIAYSPEGAPANSNVRVFLALDRPRVLKPEELSPETVPSLVGEAVVDEKNVSLVAPDDGRLDQTTELFREAAGAAIVPAHPRTKMIGKQPKPDPLRQSKWIMPEGLSRDQTNEFRCEMFRRNLKPLWSEHPQSYLGKKTPTQAAAAGGYNVPLRAALMRLGWDRVAEGQVVALAAERKRLGLADEPTPTADSIEMLHPSRMHLLDVKSLTNEQLRMLFQKAISFMDLPTVEKAGAEWVARPVENEEDGKSRLRVYVELAAIAAGRNDLAKALELYAEGRKADTFTPAEVADVRWSMAAIRTKSRLMEPEKWVPELAVLLDQKRAGRESEAVTQMMIMSLVEMGLIQVHRDPKQPAQAMLDTRLLEAVLQKYGPKITTASGELGVSAAKPQIWTPGQPGGPQGGAAGGKIWTPGGAPPKQGGDSGSKLFVPGR